MRIYKGQDNTVTVTLVEKTTISPVRYLFAAKSKQQNTYSYCLVTEIGTNLDRCNQFVIKEKTSPVPANGEIELLAGDYSYTFYELTAAQVSALDFNDIDTSLYTLVETKRMQVIAAAEVATEYNKTFTATVYNG